jgi:hypothetical protein
MVESGPLRLRNPWNVLTNDGGHWSDQDTQKACLHFKISMSNEFILQINLILISPNLVLTFYTYKVSNLGSIRLPHGF